MDTLRSLAPSTHAGESSASSPTKNISGGGDGSSGGGGSGGDGNDSWNKRRRTVGTVSTNACTSCRQARQKCDGVKPEACSRCQQRKQPCHYEPHTKTHKDDLIRELEYSRAQNTMLENTNKEEREHTSRLIGQNKTLQQSSERQRIILQTLASNGHDREIIKRLRSGETHQNIADWLRKISPDFEALQLKPSSPLGLTEVVKLFEDQCNAHDGLPRFGRPLASRSPWTKVTRDPKLMGHLFDLYFTWVHPTSMLFSEIDFRRDFRHDAHTYCSSSLVNAICAMACHLLATENNRAMQFLDIETGHNAATLCQGFFEEAKREMTPDSYPHMTSTQAFAVLYLVELSAGRGRSATSYLRSAVDGLKIIERGLQSQEAKEITFWGVTVLTTFCVGTTYQKLYAPSLPSELTLFENVQIDRDDGLWRFYRTQPDQELPARPSSAIRTAAYQAKLFCLIDDSIRTYCGLRGPVNARAVIEIYLQYREWLGSLPPDFQRIEELDNPLPHILNLHIQYHTAALQFLTPLIESRHFAGPDLDEMRNLAAWHAKSGMKLLMAWRNIYTSRFSLPINTFCIVLLCDGFMNHSQDLSMVTEVFRHSLVILHQSRAGFALCGPLQELLRRRAEGFGIGVPNDLEALVESFNHYDMDDFLDVCTRLSFVQPFDQFLHHIDPKIAEEWKDEWKKAHQGDPTNSGQPTASRRASSAGKMNIESLLND